MNDWGEDQLHREAHLASVHHNAGGAGHEGVVDHAQQIAEINPPLLAGSLSEVNDHKALIRSWDIPADKRIGRVNRWNTLEIDIRLAELWADVIDVIRHPPKNRVNDCLC